MRFNSVIHTIEAISSHHIALNGLVQLNAQTAPENILVWSTGQTGNSVFASEEGSYSAIVTNPFGCSASSNIHVTWLPVPDASISPSGPLNFCGNDSFGNSPSGDEHKIP